MLCCQTIQQLLAEVVWPVDRLIADIAGIKRDIKRLEGAQAVPGSERALADVDSDLTALELEREQLERRKDDLLRRQGRLR